MDEYKMVLHVEKEGTEDVFIEIGLLVLVCSVWGASNRDYEGVLPVLSCLCVMLV